MCWGQHADAEVVRDRLDAAVHAEPTSLVVGPVRRRIDSTLNRDHREAHQRALSAMTADRYLALIDELEATDRAVTDAKRLDVRPARRCASRCGGRAGRCDEPSTRR